MNTDDRACIAEILQSALDSVLPQSVYPNLYTGPNTEYVVWNYNTLPSVWADGAPHAARYLVQVHYYLPHKKKPTAIIQAISAALFSAGFTWPDVTDAADAEGQHYVLECEYVDGGGFYGFA